MIEEQFVSFYTAKMLKEAGFDAPCDKWYGEEGFFHVGQLQVMQMPHAATRRTMASGGASYPCARILPIP